MAPRGYILELRVVHAHIITRGMLSIFGERERLYTYANLFWCVVLACSACCQNENQTDEDIEARHYSLRGYVETHDTIYMYSLHVEISLPLGTLFSALIQSLR